MFNQSCSAMCSTSIFFKKMSDGVLISIAVRGKLPQNRRDLSLQFTIAPYKMQLKLSEIVQMKVRDLAHIIC